MSEAINLSIPFTAIDPVTGAVKYSGTASDPGVLANADTQILVGVKHPLDGWVDGESNFHPVPEAPGREFVWDWGTKSWSDPRTLSELKEARWTLIKQARDDAEQAGFLWDGSTFDSDMVSQSRIQGASQLATLALINSQPFSIGWTLADNSVRTLDAQAMIAVGTAMGQHINDQHAKGRMLRAQLDAAITPEDIEAVEW